VQARHNHLLKRFLEILAEDDFLTRVNDTWEVRRPFEEPSAEDIGTLENFGAERPEVTITMRCGHNLARILRGEADPLDVLFPGGERRDAAALYTSTPLSKAFNSTIGEMLASLASRIPVGSTFSPM
jgi:hypothetical protein